jgi:hypothetical protein
LFTAAVLWQRSKEVTAREAAITRPQTQGRRAKPARYPARDDGVMYSSGPQVLTAVAGMSLYYALTIRPVRSLVNKQCKSLIR